MTVWEVCGLLAAGLISAFVCLWPIADPMRKKRDRKRRRGRAID